MSALPHADRPISASRWAAGIVVGAVIGVAMLALPLSGHLEGPDAGQWVALGIEQFGNQMDIVGWPAIGFVAALLGMVVAIVAFVGMRDAAFASQRRRELLIDAAGYLILFATAVSTVTVFAILFAAVPATLLRALAYAEGPDVFSVNSTVITAGAGAAMRLQTGHVLVGFIAFGLLGVGKHLDATVRAWDANEAEEIAAERTILTTRLEDRTRLLQRIDATASDIRPAPAPRWKIITTTACISAAIAVAAAALATLSLIGWRGVHGGDPGNWSGLAVGSGVAAAAHTYIVSVTYLAVRTHNAGGRTRENVTARRLHAQRIGMGLLAIVSTLFIPVPLGAVLRSGPHPESIIGVATFMLLLFAVPSAVLWLRTGTYSWHEVALANTARTLRSSINDDTERLQALPAVVSAQPTATIEQGLQSFHQTDPRRPGIRLTMRSAIRRVHGAVHAMTVRVRHRNEDHNAL